MLTPDPQEEGESNRVHHNSPTITVLVYHVILLPLTLRDNFMNGLYRMFLGDARPNSDRDDWIFMDVDSIQDVIIPAARIALKVHQVCLCTILKQPLL